MRLALIAAFVGCVAFNTQHAEARPSDRVATNQKKKPARAKATTKTAKPAVTTRKKAPAKPAKVEEEKPVEETRPEEPKPVPKRSSAPVAQASDDEVPRNQPNKKR